MFLRKAAIRQVPAYALVPEAALQALEERLSFEQEDLQKTLDEGFHALSRRQPALASYLSDVVGDGPDELVQSLGYFLFVSVFMAFEDTFPTRMLEIDDAGIELTGEMLATDEALRAADPVEVLESDDVIALGQPHVIEFIQHHVQEALDQNEGKLDVEELDNVYRALLVEVLGLSHAVESPQGYVDRALA